MIAYPWASRRRRARSRARHSTWLRRGAQASRGQPVCVSGGPSRFENPNTRRRPRWDLVGAEQHEGNGSPHGDEAAKACGATGLIRRSGRASRCSSFPARSTGPGRGTSIRRRCGGLNALTPALSRKRERELRLALSRRERDLRLALSLPRERVASEASRVRGKHSASQPFGRSGLSARRVQIASSTPSHSWSASWSQKRNTSNPWDSSHRVLFASYSTCCAC